MVFRTELVFGLSGRPAVLAAELEAAALTGVAGFEEDCGVSVELAVLEGAVDGAGVAALEDGAGAGVEEGCGVVVGAGSVLEGSGATSAGLVEADSSWEAGGTTMKEAEMKFAELVLAEMVSVAAERGDNGG